eukprot:gene32743-biopygen24539
MSSTTPKLQAQLCAAVQEGHVDAVRKLLEEDGADPSVPGDDDPTRPPVYLASINGHVDVVQLLLEHNADPNQAAANGHVEYLKLLLHHNADPNQAMTDYGLTPVGIAAQEGHGECLKLLLQNNADPNQAMTDNGVTPVLFAAQEGHVECLQLLLQHNADPEQARTDDGTTPLHAAAGSGELSAAQLLVVHGASIAAAAFSGDASSFHAARNGHQHLAEWLNAVATWSPLRVAASLRMHTCITFLLQQGRLDPDDRVTFPAAEIMAAIAASTATPAELPWGNALPTCQTTIKLVRGASFGWKYSTHQLYHANVKKAVFAVLVV